MRAKECLSAAELLELMDAKRFGVEYQPIVRLVNNEIYGYECLSRFFDQQNNAIRPDLVYASLHNNPLSLFTVEYLQKQLQLANAPDCKHLFVNLDQDSYFASEIFDSSNPFVQLFKGYKKTNVVVELIENTHLSDAIMSLAMIENLTQNKLNTALDDLFDPESMLSTAVILKVDYIKLDKSVIKNQHDMLFMSLVKSVIGFAHEVGKKVILEGVETESDRLFAISIDADFVQGFLYKNLFKNVKPNKDSGS